VARLTATLEGPQSPIDKILSADAARPAAAASGGNGAAPSIAPQGGEARPGGTLADRIRALQSRASRVPQPSGA
jgi:hypothetical protein